MKPGKRKSASALAWPIAFAANLAALLGVWATQGSGELLASGGASAAIALGRLAGLVGAYLILVQLVLVSRMQPLERTYGFDKLNRLHRSSGKAAFIILLAHPLLLGLGYASASGVPVKEQIIDFLKNWEDVLAAYAGLTLLAAVVIMSIAIVRRRLRYETWYFVHLATYVAIVLAFGHQTTTADLSSGAPYYYWLMLNAAAFGSLLAFRVARPWLLAARHRFRVEKVVVEAPGVHSVYIGGERVGEFAYEAGQYANFSFLAPGLRFAHPFSFSSAPNGDHIRITVKELGDYTGRIGGLKPGTRVLIDGPLGAFTSGRSETGKYLFVAGGIGITPIRALAESLSRSGADMILLYGNRTEADVAFDSELRALRLERHDVFSDERREGRESGRIDKEKIERLVPDARERDAYLCGPPPMMDAVAAALREIGVPERRIHFEKFSY